ncbi:MAG: hypothetical protein ABI947_17090 [Chloroflexota bacterium]
MPITFQAERDGRVCLWTFIDPFTASELSEAIDTYQQDVLDKAHQKVYLICDFTQIHHLPPNIMSAGLKMIKKTHPMSGTVIEVTSNGFINAIVNAFARLTPKGMVSVQKTLPEALKEADRLIALEAKDPVQEKPPSLRN